MTETLGDPDPGLDADWLAEPRKSSRLRRLLVVLLVAGLCFLGGALVQKQYGAADASSAGPPASGGMQLPQGMPGLAPAGSDDADDDTRTAVIGTIVAIHDTYWVVRDLGGKRHRIPVGDDTDVVRETSLSPSDVQVGDSVDINGTSVTLR